MGLEWIPSDIICLMPKVFVWGGFVYIEIVFVTICELIRKLLEHFHSLQHKRQEKYSLLTAYIDQCSLSHSSINKVRYCMFGSPN